MDRDKLKESLTEVLTHYPAMTGRLYRDEEGKWGVKCNDAGVRLLDARVKGVTLDEWLETATAEEEMELAYWEEMNPEVFLWSPFYIQVPGSNFHSFILFFFLFFSRLRSLVFYSVIHR